MKNHYIILQNVDKGRLAMHVNELINENWVPQGAPFIQGCFWYQAVYLPINQTML